MSVLSRVPTEAEAEVAARAIFRSDHGAVFLAWLMEEAGVFKHRPANDARLRTDPFDLVSNAAHRQLAFKIVEMSGVKLQLGWLGLPDAPAVRPTQAQSPLDQESQDG